MVQLPKHYIIKKNTAKQLLFGAGLSAAVLFSSLSIVPSSVHAQSVRTMTVVPPTVEKTVQPGEVIEGTMKIINDSTETLSFDVLTQDYIVDNPNGIPNILPPDTLSNKYSAAAWVAVAPTSFVVAPGGRVDLNYYVQVPLDAKPGGRYTTVVFSPKGTTPQEVTGTAVNTQIGTLFYITVDGPVTEKATAQLSAPSFQEYGPVAITTEIINDGDLHITPKGTITITDMLGRSVATKNIQAINVFPGVNRIYDAVDFGQQWMVGRYEANLAATFGKANNLPLAATVVFWVFPWKAAIVIILVLTALILGGLYLKKKRGKKGPQTPQQPTDQQSGAQNPSSTQEQPVQ